MACGKGGSYLVSRDRTVRKDALLREATTVATSIADAPAQSHLASIEQPVQLALDPGASATGERAVTLLFDGNREFQRENYVSAVDTYSQMLRTIAMDKSGDMAYARQLQTTCRLNRAACQIHSERYSAAVQDCAEILALEPQNVAAIVRQAVGYERQGQFAQAMELIKTATKLDPSDVSLPAMVESLSSQMDKAAEEEDEYEFDWSKYEDSDPPRSAQPEEAELEAGSGDTGATVSGLAAQLEQLETARIPLRRREWEDAEEIQAADPSSITSTLTRLLAKDDEDIGGEGDDGDGWAAKAYGMADFSEQEGDVPNAVKEENKAADPKAEDGDEDSAPPPGGEDWMSDEEGTEGMPPLENPDEA